MPYYAMMSGNFVSNIIVADDKEATEQALKCTLIAFSKENPAGIGWTYSPETNTFSPPVEEIEE